MSKSGHVFHLSIAVLVSLLLIFAVALDARAMIVKQSLSDIVLQSQDVVHGVVSGVHSYPDGDLIRTSVELQTIETLAGEPADTVSFEVLGGELDQLGLWVEDSPRFHVGEQVVVFLRDHRDFPLVGRIQGKLSVTDGQVREYGVSIDLLTSAVDDALAGNPLNYLPQPTFYNPPPGCDNADPPSKGCHYEYEGYHWSLSNPTRQDYRYNENNPNISGEGGQINSASPTWSLFHSGAAWEISDNGTTTVNDYTSNNTNEVFFGYLDLKSGTLAMVMAWYNPQTGIIAECDMGINLQYSWSTGCAAGKYDVRTIALHEFGHFLLLGDIYDDSYDDHVMYGYGWPGECDHDLACGDRDGVQQIYGLYSGPDDDDDDDVIDDDDDDTSDDRADDCRIVCDRISTCSLGSDIGFATMGECLDTCENFKQTVVDCILGADTCTEIASCVGLDEGSTRSSDSSDDSSSCGI
ncbi:MAG: hypothetical protein P9M14_04085 [Candidatus Alcyoniella australis]|nr:hypothetical protein [Candidatus Alcyoniella australis]